jgi:hypothetical protein
LIASKIPKFFSYHQANLSILAFEYIVGAWKCHLKRLNEFGIWNVAQFPVFLKYFIILCAAHQNEDYQYAVLK